VGTRLVLYQTEEGAVDLRWHIDPQDIAHARAGFGDADAHPVLRLHRIGAGGDNGLMADADLGADADAEDGHAHYARRDAVGLLRAEIGLASDDGGWLLIARSNGLPTAGPVGADFLQAGHAASPASRAVTDTNADARRASVDGDGQPGADADVHPPAPLRLTPEFPLVEPTLSEQARAAQRPLATVANSGAPAAGAGDSAGELRPVVGRVYGSGADASLGRERDLSASAPGADLPGAVVGPEPPRGGVVPRLEPRKARPEQSGAASVTPPQPTPGSGPLRPPADGATLSAELVVRGSAPPYTLLDLGGKPYRVGAGGRFVLHIPVREHQIIMRLLATLPQLPVEAREDDPD
jgi:hypothetical protein